MNRRIPESKEYVIEALIRAPVLMELAALIPPSENGGRPRMHRNWEYIFFNELVSHFQTGGRVERELGDPRTWKLVQELAAEVLPPDEQPGPDPIRWHHFRYVKRTYLRRPDISAEYRRLTRQDGCDLARAGGNFPGDGPQFTIHPTQSITTAGDGKVIATRSKAKPKERRKDPRTGKRVKKRVDPDKRRYHEGGGGEAWGLKFLPVHTRIPFGRVILDIPFVPGVSPADEANVAVEALREIRKILSGPHFHVHDGAMTSDHDQTMLTELQIILINRTRAESNPKIRGRAIGKRKPDQGIVERKEFRLTDGSVEALEIHQVDGELGLMRLTETGDAHLEPLEPTKLSFGENKNAVPRKNGAARKYRPYVHLKLPADVAARVERREVTVALYQTEDDKKRGYLRTAHVRAIGPSNPDFEIYRRMRADSESLNRTIEDSLYRHHRAHSEGAPDQQIDMLGLAGLVNALTRERMRRARDSGA